MTPAVFQSTTLAVCACIAVFLVLRALARKKANALPLPPGPRGLPLLGNLFDIPRKAAWKTFAEWGNAYGELTLFV